MDKKIEDKIEKEVRRGVEKELEQEIEKEIKEEVKKRLHERFYESTVSSANKFKKEFRREVVVGVTAAFAFLIALSWRNPIQKSVDSLIVKFGLTGNAIYIEYLSALIITLLAVLVLMWVSRWKSEE